MKIEKISDRQFKCTLNRDDLAEHDLKLDEFAYGSEKSRALVQDMMEQAREELGFEAAERPLMIEAVPLSSECLEMTVTQVDDPEELDTRFSVFGPIVEDESDDDDDDIELDYDYDYDEDDEDEGIESFFNLLRGIVEPDFSGASGMFTARLIIPGQTVGSQENLLAPPSDKKRRPEARIFAFSSIHEVRRAASMASAHDFTGMSALYRDSEKRRFFLCLRPSPGKKRSDFTSLCAKLAEYGEARTAGHLSEEYLSEHCEPLIPENALQKLADI